LCTYFWTVVDGICLDQERDQNLAEPLWRTKCCQTPWYCQRPALKNTKLNFWVCEQYRFQSTVPNINGLWHTLLHIWASQGKGISIDCSQYFSPLIVCLVVLSFYWHMTEDISFMHVSLSALFYFPSFGIWLKILVLCMSYCHLAVGFAYPMGPILLFMLTRIWESPPFILCSITLFIRDMVLEALKHFVDVFSFSFDGVC